MFVLVILVIDIMSLVIDIISLITSIISVVIRRLVPYSSLYNVMSLVLTRKIVNV